MNPIDINTVIARLEAQGEVELARFLRTAGMRGAALCAALMGDGGGLPALPATTGGAAPGGGCGCGGGKPGGCAGGACGVNKGGCDMYGGGCSPMPRKPTDPNPNPPPAIPGLPGSTDVWNCQTARLDLNQCGVDRIVGRDALPDFQFTHIFTAPAVNPTMELLIPAVGVSHKFHVDLLSIINTIAPSPAAAFVPGKIFAQAEFTYDDNGNLVHAWSFEVQERPDFFKVTDGRCPCTSLDIGVTAEGKVRITYVATGTFAAGDSIAFTLQGRRTCWQTPAPVIDPQHAGSCPSSEICDHTALTSTELAAISAATFGLLST